MDQTASTVLCMEAMGQTRVQGASRKRGERGVGLEHGEIRAWAMAVEPEPGFVHCPSGEVLP